MAAKKKKITLAEFRAWLEGVEELQPAGWSPTADQWTLIREKIETIKEPKAEIVEKVVNHTQLQPPMQPGPNHFQQGRPFFPPPPPVPGGVPSNLPVMPSNPSLPSEFGTGGQSKTTDSEGFGGSKFT